MEWNLTMTDVACALPAQCSDMLPGPAGRLNGEAGSELQRPNSGSAW